MDSVTGVLNAGATAEQKAETHGADQRKNRDPVPTCFSFSCHAVGRSFEGTPSANAS